MTTKQCKRFVILCNVMMIASAVAALVGLVMGHEDLMLLSLWSVAWAYVAVKVMFEPLDDGDWE